MDVFISPANEQPDLSRDSREFAGSIEFFGMRRSHGHEFTATIDVTDAFDRLREDGILSSGEEIDVTIVAAAAEGAQIESGIPIERHLEFGHAGNDLI